jgi:hypothetical protein
MSLSFQPLQQRFDLLRIVSVTSWRVQHEAFHGEAHRPFDVSGRTLEICNRSAKSKKGCATVHVLCIYFASCSQSYYPASQSLSRANYSFYLGAHTLKDNTCGVAFHILQVQVSISNFCQWSTSADRRRVFLAYRTVFTGPQAQIRKSKKVREVIEQHRESFKPLIKDFGFNKVVDIVKTLLDQRVFESELKAKTAFPELFQTSPARNVQRNESENDAARSAQNF